MKQRKSRIVNPTYINTRTPLYPHVPVLGNPLQTCPQAIHRLGVCGCETRERVCYTYLYTCSDQGLFTHHLTLKHNQGVEIRCHTLCLYALVLLEPGDHILSILTCRLVLTRTHVHLRCAGFA